MAGERTGEHLRRDLAEFDFRHTNRKGGVSYTGRTFIAIKQARGKRLTYRWSDAAHA